MPGDLRKLAQIPSRERSLLLQAAAWLVTTRLALRLRPFGDVRRGLAARGRSRGRVDPPVDPGRIAWAVATAARRLPGRTTCLPAAMACQVLLARHGHRPSLRIGVARTGDRGLHAHAWVECDGTVVFGGGQALASVEPLPALPVP